MTQLGKEKKIHHIKCIMIESEMNMKQRIIVFDVDGVLLDSMSLWENSANLYLLEVYGIEASPELDKDCATMSLLEAGAYIKKMYPQIIESPSQIADGVAESIRERYVRLPEKPGMHKTIQKLYGKGYTMYLATASEGKNVKGALKNLGVWDCFKDIFTCTEIGYSKNYVEYYEEVAARIGVSCKELVMVEDSLHSMITAKKAGLTVVGVYEESCADKAEEIKKVCDVYMEKLEKLPEWLENVY